MAHYIDIKSSKQKAKKKVAGKIKGLSGKIIAITIATSILLSLLITYISAPDTIDFAIKTTVLKQETNFSAKFENFSIYLDPLLTQENLAGLQNQLEEVMHEDRQRYTFVSQQKEADVTISLGILDSEQTTSNQVGIILPVGHFYWVKGDLTTDQLAKTGVLVNSDEAAELLKQLEIPTTMAKDLLQDLEGSEEKAGFVPEGDLSFKFKLLALDGEYYLDSEEGKGSIPYGLAFDGPNAPEYIKQSLKSQVDHLLGDSQEPLDPFTINMTGVTAITRALTTKVVNAKDGAYPAKRIGEFLADADLTHVSNEISFYPGCTAVSGLRFCAREDTLDALKLSGVDIVELTGNHNNDYGRQANVDTIETYKELGWDYIGGGLNIEDAQKILYKDVDGKTVAFIAYNYWNAVINDYSALAVTSGAGANPYSASALESDVKEAKENADFVIVDFQFIECYSYPEGYVYLPRCYRSNAVGGQEAVFRQAIDHGADMVIGVQAHQPQTYEIYNGKPIFYGLGNLFFDQIYWPGTQHGLVLTHYFVKGEYVQTKITTTNYKEDMQTYVSEGEERELLLNLLKEAR